MVLFRQPAGRTCRPGCIPTDSFHLFLSPANSQRDRLMLLRLSPANENKAHYFDCASTSGGLQQKQTRHLMGALLDRIQIQTHDVFDCI
jgi:hypothetical protein